MTTNNKFNIEMIKDVWYVDIIQEEIDALVEKHKNDPTPIERSYDTQCKYWFHIRFANALKREKELWDAGKSERMKLYRKYFQ